MSYKKKYYGLVVGGIISLILLVGGLYKLFEYRGFCNCLIFYGVVWGFISAFMWILVVVKYKKFKSLSV